MPGRLAKDPGVWVRLRAADSQPLHAAPNHAAGWDSPIYTGIYPGTHVQEEVGDQVVLSM